MSHSSKHITQQLGKLPPQAIEFEESVLGALMIEKDALLGVIEILKPRSFYKPAHQEIYSVVFMLFSEGNPVDILTVTQKLREINKLEMVGGAAYIMKLTSLVNSAANIEYHARIINEQAIKRELITITACIQKQAFDESQDVFNLIDKARTELLEVEDFKRSGFSARDIGVEVKAWLLEHKSSDVYSGVLTGLYSLDRVTIGLQSSDLIILAARPAMGKTSLATSIANNVAVNANQGVAIFSLEMSYKQLFMRLACGDVGISFDRVKKKQLSDAEWETLFLAIDELSKAPIFIDDTSDISIMELKAKAKKWKIQHDIKLIIVDYLQLLSGKNKGNREQEIASISRGLKQLAKELDVPVIALSQLSRAVEARGGDKRPQLSDLRESGSIEADADMVWFLYRAEYYGITEDELGASTNGIAELIIAKHRSGALETIPLGFDGKFTKFYNLDEDDFIKDDKPHPLPKNISHLNGFTINPDDFKVEKDSPF